MCNENYLVDFEQFVSVFFFLLLFNSFASFESFLEKELLKLAIKIITALNPHSTFETAKVPRAKAGESQRFMVQTENECNKHHYLHMSFSSLTALSIKIAVKESFRKEVYEICFNSCPNG